MKSRSAICLLMLSASLCAQSVSPSPKQDPPKQDPATGPGSDQDAVTTLKVTTRVVAISAVVTSKDGSPKSGLGKDDFVLRQDGKEEPIRYFSQGSELPLTLALMVDTSASQRTLINDEALASDVFFETMLDHPGDRAMLVEFGNSVRQVKSMTNSASALHLALLSLSPRAAHAGGTLLNDAVYGVSKNFLAKEPGRKAMVILSDGGDNGSQRSLAEAIEQAQRADVQVYSILYTTFENTNSSGVGNMTIGAGPALQAGRDPGRALLQQLSDSTGGRVFRVSRSMSLREIFAEIAQDLRLQYELGYTPPPDVQANSYHKLELKARDKKLNVQARKGFFAQP